MERYLRPTATVDCDAGIIQEKARFLTRLCGRPVDKAVSLFYFVRDEIK